MQNLDLISGQKRRIRIAYVWNCFFIHFFILSLLTYPLVHAEPHVVMTTKDWSPITKIVDGMIAKEKISGAQILVQHKGDVVYFSSFGMRDLEEKSPIREDTIFRIYSMTKPITSVAAMMLVEDGRLELDRSVGDYIPEYEI